MQDGTPGKTSLWSAATDAELLAGLQAREQDALEGLIRRYGQALARAAVVVLGDGQAADDVVQETLIAAWDGARALGQAGNLRAWIFAILLNRCRNHQRRTTRWRRCLERLSLWRKPPVRPEDQVAAGDDLQQALAGLDALAREIVILRFLEGMSVAETGRVLGIPEGTVKSRTHAAIGKLRLLLRVEG